MKKFRFKTQLSIGRWLAFFGLSLALAGPGAGRRPLL